MSAITSKDCLRAKSFFYHADLGIMFALPAGEEKGRAEGEHNAKVGLVKRLLARAMSLEDIADACGLDLDEVKKIAEDE